MKATLTIVYEKEITKDDVQWLKEIVENGDDRAVSEEFGVGWDAPKHRGLEFGE